MKNKLIGRLLSFSLSAVLAFSTFSVPAFAAEEEFVLTEEITSEVDAQEEAADFMDEEIDFEENFAVEEAQEETEEESFFEEEIIDEEFEEETEAEADEDIVTEEADEWSFEDISGNSDISGNDSEEEDEPEAYDITYKFTVDGKAATDEQLATIKNPNTKTSYNSDECYDYDDYTYNLKAPETTASLKFIGWYKNGSALRKNYDWDDMSHYWPCYFYSYDGNITLTGRFVSASNVTLDYNMESMEPQVIAVQNGKTLNMADPYVLGYYFKGWYTEKKDGKKVDLKTTTITKDVTFYAQWDLVTYNVKFHTDSNAKSDAVTKTYNVTENVNDVFSFDTIYTDTAKYSAVIAKKDSFEGWTTSNDFYSAKKELKVGYMMAQELATGATMTVDMYPQWARDSYTVVFDAVGDEKSFNFSDEYFTDSDFVVRDNSDLKQTKTFYEGDGVILTGREFVRGGYKLTGWMNSATGKTIAASGKFDDLAKKGQTVTLTAIWKAEDYTITYDFNGGKAVDKKTTAKVTYNKKDTPEAKLLYNYEETEDGYSTNYEKPEIEKTGYDFWGWKDQDNNYVVQYGGSAGYKNLKLTAVWNPIYYTVNLDLNGGTNEYYGTEILASYDKEYTMADRSKFTYKDGYTLTGWKITVDGKPQTIGVNGKFKNLTTESDAEITVQAQWKANTYSITYSNGKGAKQNAVKKYTVEKTETIAAPTRNGYTFKGYSISSKDKKRINPLLVPVDESDLTKGYNLVAGSYGNIVLTANWLKTDLLTSTYKIQVLPGASGVKTSDGKDVDEKNGITYIAEANYDDITTVLGTSDFVREGFTLKGYSYKKNGPVITNATVGGHDAKNGVVTLYTVWTAKTFSGFLSVYGRNADNTSVVHAPVYDLAASKKTFTYGKAFKLPKVSVKGYKFLGWELTRGSAEGLTKDKTGKYILKINKDYKDESLLLTPVYEATNVKVTFKLQGGTVGGQKKIVKVVPYGTDILTLFDEVVDVTKKDARLVGFATDSKGNNIMVNYDGTSNQSSYYAVKATTIYAIWKNLEPKKPVNVSAELNDNYLILNYNDQKVYTNVEVQYATDSKVTKSVRTLNMGQVNGNGLRCSIYVTGTQYYARFRTYEYDTQGNKTYSDWSKTVMAIKSATTVDAE